MFSRICTREIYIKLHSTLKKFRTTLDANAFLQFFDAQVPNESSISVIFSLIGINVVL